MLTRKPYSYSWDWGETRIMKMSFWEIIINYDNLKLYKIISSMWMLLLQMEHNFYIFYFRDKVPFISEIAHAKLIHRAVVSKDHKLLRSLIADLDHVYSVSTMYTLLLIGVFAVSIGYKSTTRGQCKHQLVMLSSNCVHLCCVKCPLMTFILYYYLQFWIS